MTFLDYLQLDNAFFNIPISNKEETLWNSLS